MSNKGVLYRLGQRAIGRSTDILKGITKHDYILQCIRDHPTVDSVAFCYQEGLEQPKFSTDYLPRRHAFLWYVRVFVPLPYLLFAEIIWFREEDRYTIILSEATADVRVKRCITHTVQCRNDNISSHVFSDALNKSWYRERIDVDTRHELIWLTHLFVDLVDAIKSSLPPPADPSPRQSPLSSSSLSSLPVQDA